MANFEAFRWKFSSSTNSEIGKSVFKTWRKLQNRTQCTVASGAQKGRLPSLTQVYYLSLKWYEQRTLMNFRDASDRWFFKGNIFFIKNNSDYLHLFLNFLPISLKKYITLIFSPFKAQFLHQPHTEFDG